MFYREFTSLNIFFIYSILSQTTGSTPGQGKHPNWGCFINLFCLIFHHPRYYNEVEWGLRESWNIERLQNKVEWRLRNSGNIESLLNCHS